MPLIHRGNGTLKIEFDLQGAVFLCQNTLKTGIERECVRCREDLIAYISIAGKAVLRL